MKYAVMISVLVVSGFAVAGQTRANGDLVIEPAMCEMNAKVGGSVSCALTARNPGQVVKTSMVGTMLNPHFNFLGHRYPGTGGTCGAALGVGQTCTVVIEFAPKSSGVKRGLLRVNYWSGPRPETSFVALEAQAN